MDAQPAPKREYRQTAQRAMILEAVQQADGHLTAGEIFERVRRRDPRIGYGTVYRSLHLLAEHGLIQELTFADQASRYDGRVRATRSRPLHRLRDAARCRRTGGVDGPACCGRAIRFFDLTPPHRLCRGHARPAVTQDAIVGERTQLVRADPTRRSHNRRMSPDSIWEERFRLCRRHHCLKSRICTFPLRTRRSSRAST